MMAIHPTGEMVSENSNEPMIAIYGEFGIRLEDCLYITESGPKFFTKQSESIEKPV